MNYTDPRTVLSPRGAIKELEVIHDGGEHKWSLARMKWDNKPVMGMRWNGGSQNGIPSIGNPQSRGRPTWFVLPNEVGNLIESNLKLLAKLSK
jgi:hypothetical protein